MPTEVIVALCSLAGTLIGSYTGVLVSNRLVNHRVEQLEKKMEKYHELSERVAVLEHDNKTLRQEITHLK